MRQFTEYLARARQMPPQVLAQKVAQMGLRKARRTLSRTWFQNQGSFSDHSLTFNTSPLASPDLNSFEEEWLFIEKAVTHIMDHRFDLLGSGWQKVIYGMQAPGVMGNRYPSNPKNWQRSQVLDGQLINRSNRSRSKKILSLLPENYELIDWQVDFKSGYRWDNDQWWEQIPYGHKQGVDIKVPWELSRMQHLPWLAYAAQKSGDKKYFLEFQNQVLDFIATNPPRFGVNWKCPMDVAIRAANWVISYNLFQNLGFQFDGPVEKIVANSLFDHGLFVEQNFEKGTDFRGNHYLADIAGLTFVAYAIKGHEKIQQWQNLCKKELKAEADYQFHNIGSNFEGSTAYHRLSSEMLYFPVLYSFLNDKDASGLGLDEKLLNQLAGMGEFAKAVTKPDGDIVQVGDNDSGRFFKLSPTFENYGNSIKENHLNLSHLWLAVEALFDGKPQNIESSLISESLRKAGNSPFGSFDQRVQDHQKTIEKSLVCDENAPASSPVQSRTYTFPLEGLKADMVQSSLYEEFGLALFKTADFFLSFRCGPVGQLGRGGHDHNDQLSIELFYKGQSVIKDPGTFLYTAAPEQRNHYRSNKAHFCPQYEGREMGDIHKALFFINKAAPGKIIRFTKNSVSGVCHGFGTPVLRSINILDGSIKIEDQFFDGARVVDLNEFNPLPFSMGYGERVDLN